MAVGHTYTLRWSSRGEEIGSIEVRREYDCVVLMYRYRRVHEDWKSYEYKVFLDWTLRRRARLVYLSGTRVQSTGCDPLRWADFCL